MIKLKYTFNNCTKKLLFNQITNYIFIGKCQCNVYSFLREKDIFFLISKESGQASRGIIYILTRLAPRETSILYGHTQENYIKKRGKNNYKRRGD